jgi:peptidoglycan/LPS O-acetylase OafA/YrhL
MATHPQSIDADPSTSRGVRNLALDVLRFVAIVLVMGRHFMLRPPTEHMAVASLITHWVRGGWVGVDLFFVLSGFLIADLLFQEHQEHQRINIKRFLIRRFLKIYPAFFLFILISIVVMFFYNPANLWQNTFRELFLIQNYVRGFWSHTWSLAVEVHFYLGLTILLGILSRRARSYPQRAFRMLPVIFLMVAMLCLVTRIYLTRQAQVYSPFDYLFATHLRIDSIFFGVILAWFWNYSRLENWLENRWLRWCLVGFGLVILGQTFIYSIDALPWMASYGLTACYVGAGAILLGALRSQTLSHPWFKPFALLGRYSYAIYLWHSLVTTLGLDWLMRLVGHPVNWYLYAGLYFTVSLGLGVLVTKLLEAPVLRLRDRLFPSQIR